MDIGRSIFSYEMYTLICFFTKSKRISILLDNTIKLVQFIEIMRWCCLLCQLYATIVPHTHLYRCTDGCIIGCLLLRRCVCDAWVCVCTGTMPPSTSACATTVLQSTLLRDRIKIEAAAALKVCLRVWYSHMKIYVVLFQFIYFSYKSNH